MKRALVTGAGGFVGSHLVEALVREGWHVRAFLRYTSTGARGWLEGLPDQVADAVEFVHGDIRDGDFVAAAARDCQRIYHLAALIGIPYSYESPSAYVQTNVVGTLNVLTAARGLGDTLERMVHTSTSECYGTALSVPMAETHPLQAQSPYSASKIAADKLAESFHRSFGLRVATLRPFNTFGPRQSLRAVIPTIIAQCLRSDVVRLGNVTPARDFVYVADTVRAFQAVGDSAAAEGQVLNAATGEERSVGEVFEAVCRVLGRQPRLEVEAGRTRPAGSEVDRLLGDATRLRALTGWAPVTGFDEGLSEAIRWVEARLDGYRPGVYHV
ncbi:MAG: SDR family NAD(P)-dependent oxidoreductase [Vicinamibacterales bacterium]